MCISKVFDNLNIPLINWSKQESNKKNNAKFVNGPVNQINGDNNTISNITDNSISISATPSTQVDNNKCFRLLQEPNQWMRVNNTEDYEFLSKLNNNVSIVFCSKHSTDNYKDFISSCWSDNNGKWHDLHICLNKKSIYESQYCTFDSCFGSTIARPEFDWVLRPSHHENIRLYYYYANSKQTVINNFIRHWPDIFASTQPDLINRYVATFVNRLEKERFFSYIQNIEDEVISLIDKSEQNLQLYHCQNILSKRDELDLKSAVVLTDLLDKWRKHQ